MTGGVPVDRTGVRFTNGAIVLRQEGHVRVGERDQLRWVLRCSCGVEFGQSSGYLRRAARLGTGVHCPECSRVSRCQIAQVWADKRWRA